MLDSARLSNKEIIRALEHDSKFFINFFLAEDVLVPVPPFHCNILDLMVHKEVPQLSLAVPRAHSKTTLAQLAAIHYLLFTDYTYILYMSSSSGHAVPCVNDIVDWLKCDNFIRVFGHVQFQIEQEGKGFYIFTMPNGKRCILKAFGAGQKVRGTKIKKRRPQLVIIDDLEDNDNIANHDLFMQLKRWVYGPFIKCVDPFKNKFIWIGNMIQQESMLFENHKDPDWHSMLYGCLLEDGSTLWPDLWPLAALQKDFLKYQRNGMADVWFAEMMNMPMAGGNGIIKSDEITYAPAVQERDNIIGFLTLDLAISKEAWAHSTTINVHVWVEDSFWQITETREYKGIDPISLFWEVMEVGQRWGFNVVGIESVAYQAALKPVFEHLVLVEHLQGWQFLDVPARARKTERIVSWAAMVKSGHYALTEGDFVVTQQLLAYDPTKKENIDDIIDGCSHGVGMLSHYTYEIWNQQMDRESEPLEVQNSYAIAKV